MPVIRISDYVMNILKKYAIPLEDNADSVLRKILEEYNEMKHKAITQVSSNQNISPASREKRLTSNSLSRLSFPRGYAKRYARWIISSLSFLGGSADAQTVISNIQKTFKHQLTEKDLETLPSGEMRWVKNVNWARYDMVKGGLLNENAPYGIWELTEKGINYYDISFQKSLNYQGGAIMENLSSRQLGRLCREGLIDHLEKEWGNLYLMKSWLIDKEGKRKILSLYSDKDKDDDKWFYGIIQKDWQKWNNNCCLVLLMRDARHCSFVLFNPEESKELIDRLSPAKDGSKKINVRIPSTGKIYIEKWPEFPFAERIVEIEDKIK
jgi:hypothetical protein